MLAWTSRVQNSNNNFRTFTSVKIACNPGWSDGYHKKVFQHKLFQNVVMKTKRKLWSCFNKHIVSESQNDIVMNMSWNNDRIVSDSCQSNVHIHSRLEKQQSIHPNALTSKQGFSKTLLGHKGGFRFLESSLLSYCWKWLDSTIGKQKRWSNIESPFGCDMIYEHGACHVANMVHSSWFIAFG